MVNSSNPLRLSHPGGRPLSLTKRERHRRNAIAYAKLLAEQVRLGNVLPTGTREGDER